MISDFASLEINIPNDDPFKYDKLNSQSAMQMMVNIFTKFECGAVVALDSPWGTGKTTFIKMLQAKLKQQHYVSLYFNAWESDFSEDPLYALISELKGGRNIPKALISKIGRIALSGGTGLLKALLKLCTGVDENIINDVGSEISAIGNEALKSYTEKKETIESFRKELEKYIISEFTKDLDNNQEPLNLPVIFFVDELDRCNPNYAIKVLERIKHCFNVPNLVFVISIDKAQLKNSVKGYFHSQDFDAEEYLRRFIDIEYSLPYPNYEAYCQYLSDKFSLKYEDYSINNEVLEIIRRGAEQNQLSLRQLEKFFAHLYIIHTSFNDRKSAQYVVFFTLLQKFHNSILDKIEKKQYLSLSDLYHELIKIYPDTIDDMNYFIGQIIGLYAKFTGLFTSARDCNDATISRIDSMNDDASQMINSGINKILRSSTSDIPPLSEILDHVHLYSAITKNY